MGFAYLFLILAIISSVAVPLIFGLVRDKGKTQYKLTANICCVIFALILSFAVQFLLGANLSNKNTDDTQDTSQYAVFIDDETGKEYYVNDDLEITEPTTSNSSFSLSVNNIICGLAGYAVFIIVVLATYKSQHRVELNKIIKNSQPMI